LTLLYTFGTQRARMLHFLAYMALLLAKTRATKEEFRDQQWACDSRAYHALLSQGYITRIIETRHGVRWRLMVLP
jgi:hypothetical protein